MSLERIEVELSIQGITKEVERFPRYSHAHKWVLDKKNNGILIVLVSPNEINYSYHSNKEKHCISTCDIDELMGHLYSEVLK